MSPGLIEVHSGRNARCWVKLSRRLNVCFDKLKEPHVFVVKRMFDLTATTVLIAKQDRFRLPSQEISLVYYGIAAWAGE
jgi:hypothetical protein